MISPKQHVEYSKKVLEYLSKINVVITDQEKKNIEIADFGLNRLEEMGLQIITYINTDKYCAKELIMLPNQLCPEHRHPNTGSRQGKQETFRCRWGQVYLYISGEPTSSPKGHPPKDKIIYFTAWKQIVLNSGEQFTLSPDTLHWFQAGPEGAIISEFSMTSIDEADIWTDPEIKRIPEIEK
ncbi:MAG: D-lyxose/D-mannose family sugar isomerase [Candidatus Humimicrobiaceae bacterium]